jgi:quercetin dioxygenase-like cupin family protein
MSTERSSVMDTTHTGTEEVRMNTNPTAYALGSEDGEALWFFGTLIIFKATAEQTGGRFSLVEQLAPRGMATPLNVHREDDESFYVLEGEITVYLEDSAQPTPVSAGEFVHIPGGVVHAFRVESETARLLDLTTPQHERFMRAAGEPAQERVLPPEGLIDMEKVEAAQQQHGIEILGPPPGAQG